MSDEAGTIDGAAAWERLSAELAMADAAISRSTIMGLPCLPAAEDVSARIASAAGRPCAPVGKGFREWLAMPPGPESGWRAALADALAFVPNDKGRVSAALG